MVQCGSPAAFEMLGEKTVYTAVAGMCHLCIDCFYGSPGARTQGLMSGLRFTLSPVYLYGGLF